MMLSPSGLSSSYKEFKSKGYMKFKKIHRPICHSVKGVLRWNGISPRDNMNVIAATLSDMPPEFSRESAVAKNLTSPEAGRQTA
jgi:hypothetical protein